MRVVLRKILTTPFERTGARTMSGRLSDPDDAVAVADFAQSDHVAEDFSVLSVTGT
jgi:hypothetical protein